MERKEAAALGLTRYNTGRPCKHGHMPIRYTASGICVQCAVENAKKSRDSTVSAIRAGRGGAVELKGCFVHADDFEVIADLIDMYGAGRGLPPCPRPKRVPMRPNHAWLAAGGGA